ncbi:MAG: class I SAM-dependent methyltransferase [Nocardioides sp.]
MSTTIDASYTQRLQTKSGARWKRVLNVQAPYLWNVRRLCGGRTLDVGCGIGRNLAALSSDSVGIDHNPTSVDVAREAGLNAMTTVEWQRSPLRRAASFDAVLVAHVIEHLPSGQAETLLADYIAALRPGGRVVMICPQERGYASDPTHVAWTTGDDLVDLARAVGLTPEPWRSFPAPRSVGRVFTYNEFTVVAHKI